MIKRATAATVELGLRVKEPMRARIERSARDHGLSMNGEMVDRLEASFAREDALDRFFGGQEIRQLATLWAAAFVRGAQFGNYMQHGTPIGGPLDKKGITDPTTSAYFEGVLAVVESMTREMPTDAVVMLVESFKARFSSDVSNKRRGAEGESK
jgi:hypothetical protein